jgi:hypothetical protein
MLSKLHCELTKMVCSLMASSMLLVEENSINILSDTRQMSIMTNNFYMSQDFGFESLVLGILLPSFAPHPLIIYNMLRNLSLKKLICS